MISNIIWWAGLAVKTDGTVEYFVRKDGRLQRVERKPK